MPEIRRFLLSLGLTLHPKKMTLQPSWHGVGFLGAVIKPWQRYVSHRTLRTWHRRLNELLWQTDVTELFADDSPITAAFDSYLGYFSHFMARKVILRTVEDVDNHHKN